MAIPNKLKKLNGFHGRLFVERDEAETWLDRIQKKIGNEYEFEVKENVKSEDGTDLVLAFIYKKEV
jgi:hypothetical protein